MLHPAVGLMRLRLRLRLLLPFFVPQRWKFAFPLLQITTRVFSLITTPAPRDGYFHTFCEGVRERNQNGDYFFYFVNHALSCQTCINESEEARCVHKLHFIPPWKSIMRLASLARLVPKNRRAAYSTEVMGNLAKPTAGYFPHVLVDASLERKLPPVQFNEVYVGCDPASHSCSYMGLVAFGVTDTGLMQIVGVASVSAARCEALHIGAVIKQFVRRLKANGHTRFVPVVECNGNEIVATTIVKSFGADAYVPFTADRFSAYICPGVGVITTKATKLAGVQQLYLALADGRISVSTDVVTADRTCFDPRAVHVEPQAALDELKAQMVRFCDQPDGTISGKSAGGDEDDICMAFLLACYWRICLMAS